MRRTGFTLVELLVVISIIAALAAILIPTISWARNSAKTAKCETQMASIKASISRYVDVNGTIPDKQLGGATDVYAATFKSGSTYKTADQLTSSDWGAIANELLQQLQTVDRDNFRDLSSLRDPFTGGASATNFFRYRPAKFYPLLDINGNPKPKFIDGDGTLDGVTAPPNPDSYQLWSTGLDGKDQFGERVNGRKSDDINQLEAALTVKTTGTILEPCHPPTRRGFTLVELLAVIMIIGLLMSLMVGSFFRTRTVNKLLASEQVLSDAIRQARHTARSTGAPALLKLSPTRRPDGSLLGGVITGVSRVWVWSEFFDHGQALDVQGFTIGMSGTGRMVNQDAPWFPPELDRALRFRSGDGAYVAVAVRPPLAGRTDGEVPKQIPLILVGDNNSAAGSSFGVMLVRSDAVDPRKAAIQSAGNKRAKMMCWEILGWVRLPKEPEPVYISSFDHLPSDLARDQAKLPSGNFDITDPIGGDRWEEIGLLITNDQLTLYRNGRRVAELRGGQVVDGRTIELPKQLIPGDQIWVGQANLDVGMAYAKCPIDDARVYKLGASEFGNLPQGVYPMPDPSQPAGTAVEYRVLAHPEGRVELSSAIGADTRTAQGAALNTDAALTTGTIFLGGDFTRAAAPTGSTRGANSAQVTVAIDGRVHGSLIMVPEKTPAPEAAAPPATSGQ